MGAWGYVFPLHLSIKKWGPYTAPKHNALLF